LREKLEQQFAKLKELNSKLSRRNRILLIACVAAVLIIVVGGALLLNKNSSTALFSSLSQTEATEIIGKLQDMGVSYTYSNGTISVPARQADLLRAQLVLQGHPRSGLSYDIFRSNIDMMSTDFEKETFKLYDLQDRIAATIRQFRGVEDAVVFISTGNDNRYVLSKDRHEPGASVSVFMKDGGAPTPEQVSGIKLLVSSSCPGMKTDNVMVVDGAGIPVSDKAQTDELSGTARLKMALESDIERKVRANVTYLLNPIYGADRVRVAVNCVVDVRKKLTEITEYSPINDESIHGVLQKSQTGVEVVGQGEVTYGPPGTELNAQIPIYPNITSDGNDIFYADDKAFDYLVSQIIEQIQYDGGDIVDLSVAVVIDEERMTRTERDDLRQAVALAAGISINDAEQKVSVVNASFYKPPVKPPNFIVQALDDNPLLKWMLLGIAGALLVLIVLLILILRALSKRRKKKQMEAERQRLLEEAERERAEIEARLLEGDPHDILNTPLDQAKKTREQELKQQIGEFAELNPEIAAQLIKTWLKGGTGND